MLKHSLILGMVIALLTACGGGGGGSGDGNGGGSGNNSGGGSGNNSGDGNSGGNEGENLPGSNNTGTGTKQLTFFNANNNIGYLAVFHGLRTSDSTFTSLARDTTTKIIPTDANGYLSLAVKCGSTVTIYDLKITGKRELDLECPYATGGTYSWDKFVTSSSGKILNSIVADGENVKFNVRGAGANDYENSDETDTVKASFGSNQINTTRNYWAIFYDNGTAELVKKNTSLRDLPSNPSQTANINTEYNFMYESNLAQSMTSVDVPATVHYRLDFYSPSRFKYPLQISRKNNGDFMAALLPKAEVKNGDYYIETFTTSDSDGYYHYYKHITKEAKGSEIFGSDTGKYGASNVINGHTFTLSDSSGEDVNYFSATTPTSGIPEDFTFVAKMMEVTYYINQDYYLFVRYYSESAASENTPIPSSFTTAFGTQGASDMGLNKISNSKQWTQPISNPNFPYWRHTLQFVYTNGIHGDGGITLKTHQRR